MMLDRVASWWKIKISCRSLLERGKQQYSLLRAITSGRAAAAMSISFYHFRSTDQASFREFQ